MDAGTCGQAADGRQVGASQQGCAFDLASRFADLAANGRQVRRVGSQPGGQLVTRTGRRADPTPGKNSWGQKHEIHVVMSLNKKEGR